MSFVNAVAHIANAEDHHPDLEVGYGYCRMPLQHARDRRAVGERLHLRGEDRRAAADVSGLELRLQVDRERRATAASTSASLATSSPPTSKER